MQLGWLNMIALITIPLPTFNNTIWVIYLELSSSRACWKLNLEFSL
jgi:hypothetical protein